MMTNECPAISAIMTVSVLWSLHSFHGDLVTQDVCHDDHVLWTCCWQLECDQWLGSVDWALVTWQIWWWWDCDSDWCLPPVTPASLPLQCPVSASGAWPGLVRPPGPGRAPTGGQHWGRGQSVRDQSQLCTECYIIIIITSSQWSQWPVTPPGSGVIVVILALVRNVKRTLAASSWHPDPGCRPVAEAGSGSRIPRLFH